MTTIRCSKPSRTKSQTVVRLVAAVGLSAGIVSLTVGEEPKPQRVEVTLSPAGEESPALRRRLIPYYSDQTEGNAATFYYRALLLLRTLPDDAAKVLPSFVDWTDAPADQFPKDAVRKALRPLNSALSQVKTAARCERCDWNFRLRETEGPAVISFLLPEMQELRQIARILSVQARLAILEGRMEEAIETIGMGYRLAQDAGREPVLICGLVGIACGQMMNQRMLELLQSPQAPNLYWALVSLPRPLVDLRKAAEFEMLWMRQIFPVLKDPATADRSPDQWQKELEKLVSSWRDLSEPLSSNGAPNLKDELRLTAALARLKGQREEIRKRLAERGHAAVALEKMSDAQAALVDAAENYNHVRDTLFKAWVLPYPQAWPRLAASEKKLKEEKWLGPAGTTQEPIPLAAVLLPAVSKALSAELRLQRRIAEMTALEAIRHFAARHEGKLPESLEALADLPALDDPATGKPFPYRIEGDAALLEPAPIKEIELNLPMRVLRITLRPAKPAP